MAHASKLGGIHPAFLTRTRKTAPCGTQVWGPGRRCPRLLCVPSLLLRFWVNALKNPRLIFDVRVSDNVDAILAVIAQTFIDACTVSEHKVGRVRGEDEGSGEAVGAQQGALSGAGRGGA